MDTKCFTGGSVMSDNTLVIQLIDGSLNVVLTRMEPVKGPSQGKTTVLREDLQETLGFSDEHNLRERDNLAAIGYLLNKIVSELEAGE